MMSPLMSIDEFHDWHQTQDHRYELVDGRPVRISYGATQAHAVAVTNIAVALTPAGRALGWRTTMARTAVRTGPATIRYPNVVVDCGMRNDEALEASDPAVVIEVSSGTKNVDFATKLWEYRHVDGLRTIMLVDPDQPLVVVYSRCDRGKWRAASSDDLAGRLEIVPLGISLPIAEIYGDLVAG